MRISTGMIFDAGVSGINRQTASLLHVQQQIASGRRILTPSDDPVAAARALEVTQSSDVVAQFKRNQDYATSALGLEEAQLTSAVDVLGRVRELAIQASNTTLSATARKGIATELRSRFDQLLGIANTTDGSGQKMFSGFTGATTPFSGSVDTLLATGSEVDYGGDDGQRTLQVSPGRFIETSDSGSDVFMRIQNGNSASSQSVFVTLAKLVGALEADPPGATYSADISLALTNIDHASDNILRIRAGIGSRMNELESLGTLNESLNLQYQQTLSNLQDVDFVKAITDLTRNQTNLQAAQQSFAKISQLSLFNYL